SAINKVPLAFNSFFLANLCSAVYSKKPSTTKETPKGKTLSKGSKNGKSASAKEPVEEPIDEVVMDDDAFNTAGEDVVHDDDQPQNTS
nr:hypothetical protein [Tanacetum cinerariifolium]